jgi:hypothetical protein
MAASVIVEWGANTEVDLAGYKVYYGTSSGTYPSTLNTGKVISLQVDNLEAGKTYYVAMSAYDTSGNESAKSQEVSISIPVPDTTPPTGSILINAGAASAASRTVTLTLSATDNAGTIAAMMISSDGSTWSAEAPFASSQAWVLPEGDGIKTVYAKFKDSNGNWMTTAVSDQIQLVLDSDGDGLPDVWEIANGFNPSNAADAGIDSDGDGYNNLEEYVSNSNPNYRYDYAPIVEAGASQQSDPTRIYLDGSATHDPNGDPITYSWTQISGPQLVIENATASKADFMGIRAGTYSFMLSCSDGRATSMDTVNITINNLAPTVSAGNDVTVSAGQPVIMHAVGADANGDALSYTWVKVEGPEIGLPALTTQDLQITPQSAGLYKFQVLSSDSVNVSQADEIYVTVNEQNQAPTAEAGDDIDAQSASVVALDASRSSDPDGDTLAYSWKQVSGAETELQNSATPKPTFTAEDTGTYTFELTVSDTKVNSVPDSVSVRVIKANTPPVAMAGNDFTTKVGTLTALNGTASGDPDSDQITYAWSQISGATVELSGAGTAAPTFTPTVAGTLEFKLSVSDGQASAEDNVIITVDNINHVPVANAGPDKTVIVFNKQILNGSLSSDEDGNKLTYSWSQVAGPKVTLSNLNAVKPYFTPRELGTYVFELKVCDGKDTSAPDQVTITVQDPRVNLTSPKNGSRIRLEPVFTWNATAYLSSFKLYLSVDGGVNYTNIYTGATKTYTMNSLNYMLLPSAKYIYWYVTGEGNGLLVKSAIFRFRKM